MAGPEDEDKQHEPTQKKLDDARKKGDVAKSTDLNTAAGYGGFLIVSMALSGTALATFTGHMAGLIAHAPETAKAVFGGSRGKMLDGVLAQGNFALLPWFLVPALATLLSLLAQRGFVVAPEKLSPKLSRISPLANARNKFGRSGLFEFAKSFAKLTIYSLILGLFLWRQLPGLIETIAMEPVMATGALFRLCISFLFIVLLISAAIGGIDLLWQRQEYLRKNRMSHKELMDETKQNEGDPHIKNQRRQKGYEIAMNKMLTDVPGADVVVVNPTHYAVALKWSCLAGSAPVCVAKGTDEVARRIREIASEAGVPIHRDPPTARAIFAVVDIGQEVHPEHYEAVAAAIRFAEAMRRRARRAIREHDR